MIKRTLFLMLLGAVNAQAASFDCAKAKTADEKAICAHLSLNDKDVEMATKYRFLTGLFAMGGRGAMQDEQQAWLEKRRACGGNIRCLGARYDERLRQLNAIYSRIDKPL
ncbi:hypothetical protein J0B02_10750 [Enterobacteriaceae bacterium YMB-R22]|jgi:uncharacterized protein|uniref:Lysozyme inhibitor LprI N-terminal domain-containing protein n=2 Tax=Tenebrionibacter/Tenebrionicola group TaxID=2969848 RepID=A0A8K0XWG4_9ENTR|nr:MULTISPECIES: hypothetical protein [Tenebrionibacter/Tenebrionicola group]MBK4714197.1 hypothetical protein [Tenebrionibacter intestinalis]MBV4413292.1 hypothetical protein [Tenebrionicola larvae]MBV5094234.1 hypothetical protein [Tenebrionicola larvae]